MRTTKEIIQKLQQIADSLQCRIHRTRRLIN
jgi:hypothetical protein